MFKGRGYPFIYLNVGDVFVFQNMFYMKTNVPNSGVNLSNGEMTDFYDDVFVKFWKTGEEFCERG